MIRIIFGDNLSAISGRIQNLEKSYDSIVRVDSRKESSDVIINAAISDGLFAEKKLVILENADKITQKDESRIASHFKGIENQIADIVLIKSVAPKKVDFAGMKAVPEGFMLPKYFFMLLDSLIPGNTQKVLNYYSNIPDSVDGELIFYSLVKRVWQMIALVDSNTVPSFLGVSPWQQAKLVQQARQWSYNSLLGFYKKLFEIEKDLKTSGDPLPLKHRLDILLSTGLN